jgi:endonuclease I
MMYRYIAIAVCFLLWSADPVAAQEVPRFPSCEIDEYYADFDTFDLSSWTRERLQILLEETHHQSLPYTGSNGGDDVWKALQDVDAVDSSNVRLIYSQRIQPAEPKGTPDTWNREHVWPKSRGVDDSGEDFTDIHHLFPADWGVNSIRSSRFFNWCNSTSCARLSEEELAGPEVDTAFGGNDEFQPPYMVRGDVARALFYMNVRYPYLSMTDCPDENNAHEMAYLSVLLEWHALDPPDDQERLRNNKVCSTWQGNRNPFVDFPGLVEQLYGNPSARPFQCSGNNGDGAVPGDGSTTPPSSQDENDNEHLKVMPGDVMITAVHSDDSDLVELVTLVDLPAGLTIHITDNAYDGQAFATNEGTITLILPDNVPAGTVFGYGDNLLFGDLWDVKNDPGFALAAAGDTVIVWCTTPSSAIQRDNEESYGFLSALSFSGDWRPSGLTGDEYGTSTSAVPDSIEDFAVALSHFDNYWYVGNTVGSRSELQLWLSDNRYWEGSNSLESVSFSISSSTSTTATFEITDSASCKRLMPVLVAVMAASTLLLMYS